MSYATKSTIAIVCMNTAEKLGEKFLASIHTDFHDLYTVVYVGSNIRGQRFSSAIVLKDVPIYAQKSMDWLEGQLRPSVGLTRGAG